MGFLERLFRENSSPTDAPVLPKFDYELVYVPGKDAVQKALALREEWKLAFTPIIIGTRADFNLLTDVWEEEGFPGIHESLESAARIDLNKWFADHAGELEQDSKLLEYIVKPSDWNTHSGAGEDFSVVREVGSRKLHSWVLIAKIPTPNFYEVPGYLKLGGWNECPEAPVHVALWKKWQEEYDARILCVSGPVIEATISRPPKEKAGCYKLAREQFAYCSDIVTQGVGSIDALAATLCGGKSWYFWWD